MTVALIEDAKHFAIEAHGDQQYGEGNPYEYHLRQAVGVLERFGVYDPVLLAAAWLHDTVEDTDVGIIEVDDRFGMAVGDLVWAVTNEKGKNRAERHAKTYLKIATVGPRAVLLKLADRIANVEECVAEAKAGRSKLLGMYQKEQSGFEMALRTKYQAPETETRMWDWLNQLLAT